MACRIVSSRVCDPADVAESRRSRVSTRRRANRRQGSAERKVNSRDVRSVRGLAVGLVGPAVQFRDIVVEHGVPDGHTLARAEPTLGPVLDLSVGRRARVVNLAERHTRGIGVVHAVRERHIIKRANVRGYLLAVEVGLELAFVGSSVVALVVGAVRALLISLDLPVGRVPKRADLLHRSAVLVCVISPLVVGLV